MHDSTPPIDLKNLQDNAMGDDDFFHEMIKMFIGQSESQISCLKNLCMHGKNEQWVDTAHALKGTAGHVGAEPMRLLCETAQNMPDAPAAQKQEITQRIYEEFLKVKRYLIENRYI